MIKNHGPKNPPPGRNLGPKFPPHVGRSQKKIWKQFRPYIKMSMTKVTLVTFALFLLDNFISRFPFMNDALAILRIFNNERGLPYMP